ncbi:MAG: UvrD-helicase domain-containing protein [Bacillota bacterium]
MHAPVGTGKTLCLAERAARAIRGGTVASRMLCVTFTNLAAAQMQSQVLARCGQARAGIDVGGRQRRACGNAWRFKFQEAGTCSARPAVLHREREGAARGGRPAALLQGGVRAGWSPVPGTQVQ